MSAAPAARSPWRTPRRTWCAARCLSWQTVLPIGVPHFVGEAEHFGPGVLPAPPALQKPLAHQLRDDLGRGEAVDAGALHHVGLVQTIVLRDRNKDRQLARPDEAQGMRSEKSLSRLFCLVQQVRGRAVCPLAAISHGVPFY